jgi:sodium-dependent dicarboxylate transporter 2/3/5
MCTPISSPPNAVAVGFLQKEGYSVGFLEWILMAMPLVLVLIFFTWLLLAWLFPPATKGLRIIATSRPLTLRGWYVVSIFVITVLLWVTDHWHGLPASIVALFPAVAFTATGLLDRNDVNRIDWNILILIAGGISLGEGMQMTHLDQRIVQWLPDPDHGLLVSLAVLVFATLVVGTFMSNTAAANLLLPIGMSLATAFGTGAPVVQIALSIALISAVTMALPVSTPPNAMAYATGEITTRDLAVSGITVGVFAALLVIFLSGPVLRFFGIPS